MNLILITALGDVCHYDPTLDGETEALRDGVTCEGHIAR